MDFLQQNMIWVATAVVSGALLLLPLIRGQLSGASLSPTQATQMINREDAIVLDVREPGDYAQGHIPNARLVPAGQVEKRLGEFEKYKDKPIILHCQNGSRAAAACAVLRKGGFTKVFSLQGGIGAWEQAGLPLTKK
ncbi:MAG TPA: rhodanese-like domain-containing protein [Acidiferrobacterales bacterium]|nr:rhodanese-like domain-containing protein [Acidiferrobacterales bacterium]